MHRDPKAVRIQTKASGHELPSKGTGLRLEVVTKTEISHHLEEGEVATSATHLV